MDIVYMLEEKIRIDRSSRKLFVAMGPTTVTLSVIVMEGERMLDRGYEVVRNETG